MSIAEIVRLLAIAACTLIIPRSSGAETLDTLTVEDIYDSFIDQDFVVEGTVESIDKENVFPNDLTPGLGGKNKMPMARVKFNVSRVLIGDLDKYQITVVGMDACRKGYGFDLEVGDRYILALYYSNRGSFNKGGTYPLRGDDSRFLIIGDRWFRGRKDKFMSTGTLTDLYRVIEEINRMRSVDTLSREADLIVRGTVLDAWNEDEGTETGETMNVRHVELKLSAVMKGALEKDAFTFQMLPYVNYRPSWYKLVSAINPEEEWIVFLKWIPEIGYYPFAGKNGMFKVEEDHLIRDNRIVLKQTPEQLAGEVARTLSSGGDEDEK
jgi:hypothetical protein